jgi:uncharacterized phage infection (PIP) family protein YhgE
MKPTITRDMVADAIRQLKEKNQKVTLQAIHAALGGRGSITTLVRLRQEIEAEATAPQDSDEGLALFRQMWSAAVTEGRKQLETQMAELRAGLEAVTLENEKLEAAAIADDARVDEIEAQRNKLVDELSQANKAATDARAAGADAANRLAAALGEIAQIRGEYLHAVTSNAKELAAERERSHSLAVERATLGAQLEGERVARVKAEKDLEAEKHQSSLARGKLVQTTEKLEAAQDEIKRLMKPKPRNTPKA